VTADSAIEIPFNRATLAPGTFENIQAAFDKGHISGDGSFTRECQDLLAQMLGGGTAQLTTSCTDALEMAALLLDIGPGDEVVVPTYTFPSTANAFVLRGAKLVFADIRGDTLNIDETRLLDLFTPRTRAVVPVHYAGVGCEMDAIVSAATQAGVDIVEDNAHGFTGTYRGRNLGTFGRLATLSFHETKNFSSGEGGAIIINDPSLVERAEILREKGTDRSKFWRGEVDKYTWQGVGSSYLPSDLTAAVLLAQLKHHEWIQKQRHRVWDTYHAELRGWAESQGVRQPIVPSDCVHSAHIYYLIFPAPDAAEAFIDHLRHHGILAVTHYVPLHSSPFGVRLSGGEAACPVADDVAARLVRLPLYADLDDLAVRRVISAVCEFPAATG